MNKGVKRSFIIGDNWLYYKIYMGTKTSDMVLTDVLRPIVSSLIKENIIDKWFFIRYSDPKPHIRLRFHYNSSENLSIIVSKLQVSLTKLVNQDIIWRIQTETYHRELERYGSNTIEIAEELFYHNSEMIVVFLDIIEGEEGEELRWLFAMRAIHALITGFKYDLQERLKLLEWLKTSFGNEFGMNRYLKKQLDDKYRKKRGAIEKFMVFDKNEIPEYKPILDILETHRNKIEPLADRILYHRDSQTLQVELDYLLGSYIHMLMNRIFKSKNRLHEMVCYDFLYRYYRSLFARQSKKSIKGNLK